MAERAILLLVEGEVVEPKLLNHFYNLYGIHNIRIVAYKTNLYALYHRLKKDYADQHGDIDYAAIDVPLFLNDYFQLEEPNKLNRLDFSDILLIFDFDPQDPSYTSEKLLEMLHNFSNSTDIGKLYINYPMVESYRDIAHLTDGSFITSTVQFEDIQRAANGKNKYKKLVQSRSCIPGLEQITPALGKQLITAHRLKLDSLVPQMMSNSEKHLQLCIKQCNHLVQFNQMWVVNTSLLHFADEYGELRY